MELLELLRTNQAEFAREARKMHLRREYGKLRKLERQQAALAAPASQLPVRAAFHLPQPDPKS